jgi:hypothetical protein
LSGELRIHFDRSFKDGKDRPAKDRTGATRPKMLEKAWFPASFSPSSDASVLAAACLVPGGGDSVLGVGFRGLRDAFKFGARDPRIATDIDDFQRAFAHHAAQRRGRQAGKFRGFGISV